ncbi:MAG: hypothetical protein KDA36_13670, partial [Planctomycetaceae bacterium]|nr:hypothetical protein [Planctomycetaceae bacterium]
DWSLIRAIKSHNASSVCVGVSEDGKLLATAGKDSKAQIYRTDDFSVVASFNISQRTFEIHLMDNGKTLIVMANDRVPEMYCIDGDSPILSFNPYTTVKENTLVTHDPWGHVHFYRSPK